MDWFQRFFAVAWVFVFAVAVQHGSSAADAGEFSDPARESSFSDVTSHRGRPAIVDVRILERDLSLPPESRTQRYFVEVEKILNGWVPASVLAVTHSLTDDPDSGLALRVGACVRVVLVELPDGSYRVVSARPSRPDDLHDPLPPPLAILPEDSPPIDDIPVAKADVPSYEQQVVELVNEERWNNGQLPPLKQVAELHDSSETHSSNMAGRDFFAHCDPDTGSLPWDRMTAAGYFWNSAAENIAAGYSNPSSVMAGWMASSGHRANILSTSRWELGVGYVLQSDDQGDVRRDLNGDCTPDSFGNGPYSRYWTQNFGRRNSVYPVVINREEYVTTVSEVDLYVYGEGWAEDMRFSNDGSNWSSWESYLPNKSWTLPPGNGIKTVFAQIRNGGTVREASDTIILEAACDGQDYIDLTSATVTTTEVYEACIQISAGPDYQVASPGDVSFQAPAVVLRNGFALLEGVLFRAGD